MGLLQTGLEGFWGLLAQSPLGGTATAAIIVVATILAWAQLEQMVSRNASEPPVVRYYVPFIGSMVEFGIHPIKFIRKHQRQHGNFFTFLMFGRRMTVCVDIDGNDFVFNAKHSAVTAEDAYNSLTKPVFGEGVVYDVPNAVLMEQKRM
ncbi:Lanosterol 14-alpha-demethylase, partial [Coemansia sp. RSA 2049]